MSGVNEFCSFCKKNLDQCKCEFRKNPAEGLKIEECLKVFRKTGRKCRATGEFDSPFWQSPLDILRVNEFAFNANYVLEPIRKEITADDILRIHMKWSKGDQNPKGFMNFAEYLIDELGLKDTYDNH